jgi:hypothetical protein
MSELDIMRGRSPGGGRGPQRVRRKAEQMEVCLLSPQCLQRHKPSACDKFKGLSLQHRRSVMAAKELCAHCLRHSGLDAAQPHWLSSEARDPRGG